MYTTTLGALGETSGPRIDRIPSTRPPWWRRQYRGTINECLECALGTYAESEQSEECDSARPGWYVDEKGASEEKECKRGTYTETEGQSSCSDARAGYFVDADGASDR